MNFYQRIRDLREDADTTQEAFAKIINISPKQYQRYERGESEITLTNAVSIANYHNVSLDYIAGRTNDKRGLTKSELTAEETELIKQYRALSEKRQGKLFERLEILSEDEREEQALRQEAI